jgi:hypothetical protein
MPYQHEAGEHEQHPDAPQAGSRRKTLLDKFASHHGKLADLLAACETFVHAAETKAR